MEIRSVDIVRPVLQRLHGDWDSRRRGRRFPARADFDPLDLKYVLGYLSLVEVRREPPHFRYRLHASNLAARLGLDLTGKSIESIPSAEQRDHARRHYAEVVGLGAPIAYPRRLLLRDDDFIDAEALVLPLAADGSHIDMLMSALVWR
ncbi:MAG TPA: PAS domain-containing protein [Stellaceae bacterium]|nr:PAS domain-containing protein [Stellaceae bacterium]